RAGVLLLTVWSLESGVGSHRSGEPTLPTPDSQLLTAVPPSSRAGLNRGPHPYQGCALPTELRERRSGRRDSNPRPSAWKADALPTELHPRAVSGRAASRSVAPSASAPPI